MAIPIGLIMMFNSKHATDELEEIYHIRAVMMLYLV
jgi:hypothetical protein